MVIEIGTVAVLVVLAYIDIRKKSLPIILLAVCFIAGLIYLVSRQDLSLPEIICAVLFAGCIYVFGRVSGNQVGSADALIILILGMVLGFTKTAVASLLGFILCGIFGGVLMILKKATMRTTLPFIPFLTMSLIIVLIIGGC